MSRADAATNQADSTVVVLGRVSGVHGIRGWVKLFSYTSPRDGILEYSDCRVLQDGGWSETRIVEGRRQGKSIVARFEGIDDRDAAAALIDREIGVLRGQMPEPDEGSYYWSDLEGLRVDGVDGKTIGHVDHLIETGANDVLVVAGSSETLIPFLPDSVVKMVDLDAGVIVVDWEWE